MNRSHPPSRRIDGSFSHSAKRLIPHICLYFFLSVTTLANAATDTASRFQEVDDNIRKLQNVLAEITAERSMSQQQLQRVEQEMAVLGKEIRDINNHFRTTQRDIRKLQRREQKLSGERTVQQNTVSDSIRAAFLASQSANMKVLLSQEDPSRSTRMQVYDSYINHQRATKITEFNQTITTLQQVQLKQQKLAKQLNQQQQRLNSRRGLLGGEQKKREQILSSLSQKAQTGNQRLNSLREERKELELILTELQRRQQQSDSPHFASNEGKLPWPVKGKVRYQFGQKKPDATLPLKGMYINSQTGNEIRAVHDGKVVFSNWIRGYGMLLIIDHGNDYMTLYAHNATLLKQVGEPVLSGEVIATVGDTGGQPQTGLYFEIRHNGNPINPIGWLKKNLIR